MSAITPEIEAMAGGAGSAAGTGGMVSKLAAAKIATRAGCRVVIAPGARRTRSRGSRPAAPAPASRPAPARGARARNGSRARSATMGVIRIDAGAARALKRGSSLLPAGVTEVEGAFERGDAGPGARPRRRGPGQGPVAPTMPPTRAGSAARGPSRSRPLLGWRGRDELIHRDDLVLL